MTIRYLKLCIWLGLLWGCGSTGRNGSASNGDSAGRGGSGANTGGEATQGGGKSQGGSVSSGDSGRPGDAGAEQGGSSNGGGTSVGGTAGAAGGGCTGPLEEKKDGLCVAKMVTVPAGYSIDVTEVTRLQYQTWLATSPDPDPTCTPKTSPSYEPDAKCLGNLTDNSDDPDHLPEVCIDWCDAAAYCKGVGKRLCGKIGGGPTPFAEFADAASSQWFNACSSGGVNAYVYGNTPNPSACNGYDNPTPGAAVLVVGSLATCQSSIDGYQGIFDLSGNVHEWEDACQGLDAERFCKVRGGAFYGSPLECNTDGAGFMTNPGQTNFGIRCCKD